MEKFSELMGVRFDAETYGLIQKVASAQGIGGCDFIRMATRRELARLKFISGEEKKALEIVDDEK